MKYTALILPFIMACNACSPQQAIESHPPVTVALESKPQPPKEKPISLEDLEPATPITHPEYGWTISVPDDSMMDPSDYSFEFVREHKTIRMTVVFSNKETNSLDKIVYEGVKDIEALGAQDVAISKIDGFYKITSHKATFQITQFAFQQEECSAIVGFAYEGERETKIDPQLIRIAKSFKLK